MGVFPYVLVLALLGFTLALVLMKPPRVTAVQR
jgi:hypothetical protein